MIKYNHIIPKNWYNKIDHATGVQLQLMMARNSFDMDLLEQKRIVMAEAMARINEPVFSHDGYVKKIKFDLTTKRPILQVGEFEYEEI